jgi:cell division protein FtsL
MKLKRAGIITKLVILALLVYAGISLFALKQQTEQAKAQRDELQRRVDGALQENSELEYDLNHSDDPEIIEDIARNDIGLVRPEEKIFIDVGE